MDVDKILKKISLKTGETISDLKDLFNNAKSELEEQFGDALNEDRKDILALIRVGKGYDITKAQIDSMASDGMSDLDADIIEAFDIKLDDPLNDLIDEDGDKIDDMGFKTEKKNSVGRSGWKDFMADIPEPSVNTEDYEKTPSLIVDLGCTYYIKINDLVNEPYEHEMDGTYGPYTVWAFKITLIKISDEDLYDNVYSKGDFEGKLMYVDGQNYTLWLNEKAREQFAVFWKKLTADGIPDDRVFAYKFSKRGKYNNYQFKLPKKR